MYYSWFVLFVLAAIYAQQQWSRYSLNYLYNTRTDDDSNANYVSISVADSLSFSQYGILTGYGFSCTFCVAGLVAGRLADVGSRRLIIFCGVVTWNLALLMMGYSTDFVSLLGWRLLLGFGQGFTNPASYSLIADYFPESKRSEANGLFACGVYIGGGLASLSTSMAVSMGWRNALFLIAAFGFTLASVEAAGVRDPPRANMAIKKEGDVGEEASSQRTTQQCLTTIFTNKLIVLIYIAASLRFCGGYVIGGYLPTFYTTVFPGFETEYSYINAYVVAFGGFLSSWLGGLIADRWQASGETKARLYLPVLGCVGALPFIAITCLVPSFYISILLGLFFEYLVAECWFGPVVATMQSALPPDCRALAIACFTLIATFWGSLASFFVGALYDHLLSTGYPASVIKWLVLWSVVASYTSAGIIFLYATQHMDLPASEKKTESQPLLYGLA